MKMIEINDSQFDSVVLKSALPVLLECTSPECIICKTMAARINEVGKDFVAKMVFLQMNINENKRWQNFGVRVIPTLLYFKDGIVAGRQDNFPEAEEIRGMIKKVTAHRSQAVNIASEVKTALDFEHAAALFYKHVSSNVANGKARENFLLMHQESLVHKELLQAKLKELTGETYAPSANRFEKAGMRPQSFSAFGALKTAIKIEEKLLAFYKKLKNESVFPDHELLKRLLKEEAAHLKGLKKERRYVQDKELFSAMESPDYPSWLHKVFE